MDKCLILFVLSGALWLLFKLFEEISYKFWGTHEFLHRTFRMLTNITKFVAYLLVLVTLVFTVYIFIFG